MKESPYGLRATEEPQEGITRYPHANEMFGFLEVKNGGFFVLETALAAWQREAFAKVLDDGIEVCGCIEEDQK